MPSHFDLMSHPIKCTNPQCGQVFEETYRRLLDLNVIVCPTCSAAIDIRKSKSTGEIGSWINTVAELDKKIDKKK